LATALVILALGAPAATASKRPKYVAPPGNSAVQQYLEVVPTDSGTTPPRAGGSGSGAAGALSPGQRRTLDGLGSQGRQLAAVVQATAPLPTGGGGVGAVTGGSGSDRAGGNAGQSVAPSAGAAEPESTAGPSGPAGLAKAASSSPVSSVIAAATGRDDGGGMGILLPVLMIAGVLAVVAGVFRRRPPRGS
jgi:hypothetical protein